MGTLGATDQDGRFELTINFGGMLPPGLYVIHADSHGLPGSRAHARLIVASDNGCLPVET